MAFAEDLKRARTMGVPLMAITTADQINTYRSIGKILNGQTPILIWDAVKGLTALGTANETKNALIRMYQAIDSDVETAKAMSINLVIVLAVAESNLVNKGVLIIANAHRQLEEIQVIQGLMNLRDRFTEDIKSLMLLGPSFRLPEELTQDILVLDDPLPDEERIGKILDKLASDNDLKVDAETRIRATSAVKGLSEFSIEQATALSVRKDEKTGVPFISINDLWGRKRRMLEQVPGLVMVTPTFKFEDIGGLAQVKQFAVDLFKGPCPPEAIIFIDEIEKSFAGSGADGGPGDSSGTTQDQSAVILKIMENFELPGQINFGPPGSGKSMFAKAMAASFGIPCLEVDLGAAKGSLVGESEKKIRAVMKAVQAIAGEEGAYFVATCNKLNTLSPELRRRFRFGLWFFDLCSTEERISIAKLISQRPKFSKIKADTKFWAEETEGWSGANIRDCFDIAWRLNRTVREASRSIVPAAAQDKDGIKNLRRLAHQTFLSASNPGVYIDPTQPVEESTETVEKRGRKLAL